jgi:streptomycin 6-kinase
MVSPSTGRWVGTGKTIAEQDPGMALLHHVAFMDGDTRAWDAGKPSDVGGDAGWGGAK